MAALAVGRHQQPFLAQCKSVNRVHVRRIHARQPMLFRHPCRAVALTAGARNIQRINVRARIGLRKNRVRAAVATRAGMLLRVRMHAARQPRGLIGMATLALHLRYLVRMRIFLDRRMAIVALHAAVNAVRKRLAIHCDAVTVRILHALVAVTGQAIGLRT